MYLFEKKVDLYQDVLASALEVAKKVLDGEQVDVDNEDCAKYKGGYTSNVKSKYYIDQKITVACLEYDSMNDGVGGLVTLYCDTNKECNVKIYIRVLTPDLLVKTKYSKLNIGDKVRVRGLVDLMVSPGICYGIKIPTLIAVTILE